MAVLKYKKQFVALAALLVLMSSLFVLPGADSETSQSWVSPEERAPRLALGVAAPRGGPRSSSSSLLAVSAMTDFNATTLLAGTAADQATGVYVDAQGYIYACGYTTSTDLLGIPVDPLQETHSGGTDGWFIKSYPNHTLCFSSYWGGEQGDYIFDCVVDSDTGLFYMTGYTESSVASHGYVVSDNANQSELASSSFDAFVLVVNSSGGLFYSSFYGGLGTERAHGIDIDAWGTAYVVGTTESDDGLPWGGVPENSTWGGGMIDSFLFATNVTEGSVPYSTYILNGAWDDQVWDVVVIDEVSADNITVAYAGITNSSLPTTSGAYSSILHTTSHMLQYHRIDGAVGTLDYSTYVGGTLTPYASGFQPEETPNIAYDEGLGAVVFASAVPYVDTSLFTGFPYTSGAPQKTVSGGTDGWLGWISTVGYGQGTADLLCATYLGGQTEDYIWGVAVGEFGQVFVVGESESANFPLRGPSDRTFGRPVDSQRDVFVSRYTRPSAWSTDLNFSTLHSDGEWDSAWAVCAVPGSSSVVVASNTQETGDPQDVVISTVSTPTKPRVWELSSVTNVTVGEDVRVVSKVQKGNSLDGAQIDSVVLSVRYEDGSLDSSDADEGSEDYWSGNVTVDSLAAARWEWVVRAEDGGCTTVMANLTVYEVEQVEEDEETGLGLSVDVLVDFFGEYGWYIFALVVLIGSFLLGVWQGSPNAAGMALNVAVGAVYVMCSMWGLPSVPPVWQSVVIFIFGAVACNGYGYAGVVAVPAVIGAGLIIMTIYTLATAGICWLALIYGLLAGGTLFFTHPDANTILAAGILYLIAFLTAMAPAIPAALVWLSQLLGLGGG